MSSEGVSEARGGGEERFARVARRIAGVEGWLTQEQARRLHTAAGSVAAGAVVVEIGSFRGRSTIVLASAVTDTTQVVAVDPHGGGDRGPREIAPDAALGDEDHTAFCANLDAAGVTERVRHIRKTSAAALTVGPDAVDLLFVDGAHRLGPALRDLRHWGGRVKPGGVMFVHDAFSSVGVTAALALTCFASRRWRYAGRTGSLAEYRRADASATHTIIDASRQVAQLPWFLRNLAVKALIVARLRRLTVLLGHRGGHWPY